jgi:hypothetical protein
MIALRMLPTLASMKLSPSSGDHFLAKGKTVEALPFLDWRA